jgi:kynurenine formamidase
MQGLLRRLNEARVIDLAQPCFQGMPHWPSHPPFARAMTKLHGDYVLEGGVSSAAESIALGSHVGTHIDALCHFSLDGRLHGGAEASEVQSEAAGIAVHSVDRIAPILRRGILLDIVALFGGEPLEAGFEILPEHLDEAELEAGVIIDSGDVVLLRTGWGRYWREPRRYMNELVMPGAGLMAARWLTERGASAVGSDTAAFERLPSPRMEVHVHLLVESGVHIIENLMLEDLAEELAASAANEFAFVAAPLKIEGATGAPLRPVALLMEEGDE